MSGGIAQECGVVCANWMHYSCLFPFRLMQEQIRVAVASAEKAWEQDQHRRSSSLDPVKTEVSDHIRCSGRGGTGGRGGNGWEGWNRLVWFGFFFFALCDKMKV